MKIKDSIIAILTLLVFSAASGQKTDSKITISGLVKDSLQLPVKGANIFIDSKKISSVTNGRGFFKIKVSSAAEEIIIMSPLKGVSKTKISGRSSINFTLFRSASLNMDSLIKATKSIVKKKSDDSGESSGGNHRYSSYSNMYEMIKGEVPGVVVRGTSIYVQGMATFGGNSEALFVVDGIVAEQINDVLPLDVMSIQLLKGAATAAYGMRGANGVIFITTLRGTEKK